MLTIETSVVINRPIEEVFAFVSDVENTPSWAGPVIEAQQTSAGPIGVGTTSTRVIQFLGRRMESTYEVTEYEPQARIYSRSTTGPVPIEERFTFQAVADGTQVTLVGELDAAGFFKLAEPVLARMVKRQVENDAGTLKDLLEAQT
jgi:uncharacterized protein YndB with AHSA1/START domain